MPASDVFAIVLAVVLLIVAPVALRFLAEDEPRNDDPPDTADQESERTRLAA
jgi:hypothetical protein